MLHKQNKVLKRLQEENNEMREDLNSLKDVMGLFLDAQARIKKYVEPKAEEKPVEKKQVFSIKVVREEDRPPYWDYEIDGYTLWKLRQSNKGKVILQKILDSHDDSREVIESQKAIRAFAPAAKKILKKLREEFES